MAFFLQSPKTEKKRNASRCQLYISICDNSQKMTFDKLEPQEAKSKAKKIHRQGINYTKSHRYKMAIKVILESMGASGDGWKGIVGNLLNQR